MEIGLIIKNTREKMNIKQAQIANALNIDQSIYSKMENGVRKIKIEELTDIARILKVPIAHFFPNSVSELENLNLIEQIQALKDDNNIKNDIIKSLLATIKKLENNKT
jgi:transcriptional regulator with XRE-family HTH domain